MQQRYYDPGIGTFLSVDPVTAYEDPIGMFNRYKYANNNPYRFTDPDGRAFLVDDAAGFLVGGVIGVAVQAGVSVATGQDMTWGDAAGAFVSGGIVGVGAVNAPETGGVSFAVAVGGVAGAAGNSVKQSVDIATGAQATDFSGKDVAIAGVVGAATAGLTEGALSNARIPGLSSGRNNMNAVGKAAQTRIANGNASRMSGKTALKAAIGSQAAGAKKTVGEAAVEITKHAACSANADGC
jgi:uncharacterized protein RhaS with RHS repeats